MEEALVRLGERYERLVRVLELVRISVERLVPEGGLEPPRGVTHARF